MRYARLLIMFCITFGYFSLMAEEEFEKKWQGTISADLSMLTGNSEEKSIKFGGNARQQLSTNSHFQLAGKFKYVEKKGCVSTRKGDLDWKYEEDLLSNSLWFLKQKASFDKEKGIDFRLEEAVGVGYFFLKEETRTFKVNVGAGRDDVFYTPGSENDRYEGKFTILLGWQFGWEFNAKCKLSHEVYWIAPITSWEEFKIDALTAITCPLSEHWELCFKHDFDYLRRPPGGKKLADHSFSTEIGYRF